jgi:hypothetical protein
VAQRLFVKAQHIVDSLVAQHIVDNERGIGLEGPSCASAHSRHVASGRESRHPKGRSEAEEARRALTFYTPRGYPSV